MIDNTEAKILTDYVHSIGHTTWTEQQSLDLIMNYHGGISSNAILDDHGRLLIVIEENSIKVNGKDITGNSGIYNTGNMNIGGDHVTQTISGASSPGFLIQTAIGVIIIVASAFIVYKFGWNNK